MNNPPESSDQTFLDCMRRLGSVTISQLVTTNGVTATAVRQRLNRLMAEGLVERKVTKYGRGRPRHEYSLTTKGARHAGTNYSDLAMTLWEEIREIKNAEVRSGLLKRIAGRLAERYKDQVTGVTLEEQLGSLVAVMGNRDIPLEIDRSGELPVLTILACPYPDLAEQDRGVCTMEKMLFSEMAGEDVRLTECRLDGSSCCTFQPAGA